MGLDQNAWAVEPKVAHLSHITERELTDEELAQLEGGRIHIQYWRKHADLNKWMTDLYERKGGMDVFNCIPLVLEKDDLLALQSHIDENNGYAERGEGFFWGQTQEEDIARDRDFIRRALHLLEEGYEIIYNCWW